MADVLVTTTNRNVIVNERSIDVVVQDNVIQVDIIGGPGPVGPTGPAVSYRTTSTQTVEPELGNLQLVTAERIPYSVGQRFRVTAFDDALNYFEGYIDSDGDPETNVMYLVVDLLSLNRYEYNDWRVNITGEPGRDLYAQAVNDGFVGTENDFNATFVGPQGPQGIQGIQGPAGVAEVYSATLGSVTTATITAATHEITSVKNVTLYHPDGNEVSVAFSVISNNVTINSNINLLNHIIKIY